MTNSKYLTTREAAAKAHVSLVTIVAWCEQYGIGRKVGGRWRVDPKEFKKVLDGKMHQELKRPKRKENIDF